MNGWMILWTAVLITAVVGFLGILLLVGQGAVRELWEMLDDLRHEAEIEQANTAEVSADPD